MKTVRLFSLLMLAAWFHPATARAPKPRFKVLPVPVVATDSCGHAIKEAAPIYPLEALQIAQPGWVLLTFSVATDGTVSNAAAPDSSPKGFFEKSAIKAVFADTFAHSDAARDHCSKLIEFKIGRWDY